MNRQTEKDKDLQGLMARARVRGTSHEDWRGLVQRHAAERAEELSSLRIPPAMENRLAAVSTKVLDAISVADPEQAYRQGATLGLRHRGLVDFLRSLDRAQQYDYAKKLINPSTFEVWGAGHFRDADKFRSEAQRVAAHYGVPPAEMEQRRIEVAQTVYKESRRGRNSSCDHASVPGSTDIFRRWNYAQSQGEGAQSRLLHAFRTSDPRQSYIESIGVRGLSPLSHAIGKFDPSVSERHSALESARSSEHAAFNQAERVYEARERAKASIRVAVAQAKANPYSVPRNISRQIYLASFGESGASPLYREVLEEKGMTKDWRNMPAPTSVVHLGMEDYKFMKKSLDAGSTAAMSDAESFFRAAYYRLKPRGVSTAGEGSVYHEHARAGLMLLAKEYQSTGNLVGLRALERLAPEGSLLVSAAERAELFKSPVVATQEAALTAQRERAQKWSESLERFIARQGNIPRSEALKLASKRLLSRFSAEKIREMQQLTAATSDNSRHNELRSVFASASEGARLV